MLVRADERGTLLIGQPSHAWISGQIARAWGNATFGRVEPYDEVCLAAEQHDIGMASWDLVPERNPETGLPLSFTEMPVATHLELWRGAPRRLLRQSRYAALLVSMHGTRLYEMRDLDRLAPADADAVRDYFAEQRRFQVGVVDSLREDPISAPSAGEAGIARNSQLIWTWDFLSLALCLSWAPCAAGAVPTAAAPVDLALAPGTRPGTVLVAPWPFRYPEPVTVRCEGQRLGERFDTDEALVEALDRAPWETLVIELARA